MKIKNKKKNMRILFAHGNIPVMVGLEIFHLACVDPRAAWAGANGDTAGSSCGKCGQRFK